MKVDITKYEEVIKQIFKTKHVDLSIYDDIVYALNEFLVCSECKQVVPKEYFSIAKAFKNRHGRYPICKVCCKQGRLTSADSGEGNEGL